MFFFETPSASRNLTGVKERATICFKTIQTSLFGDACNQCFSFSFVMFCSPKTTNMPWVMPFRLIKASSTPSPFNFLDISKTLYSVMQQYYKTISLPEFPSFLKHILTIEDAVKADHWGREKAMSFMS